VILPSSFLTKVLYAFLFSPCLPKITKHIRSLPSVHNTLNDKSVERKATAAIPGVILISMRYFLVN
jgi:hypothetical protein